MKDKTQKLLDKVNENHDWDSGQVYGGAGTRMSSTDTCRCCGLVRRWFSDTQNGVEDRYTFEFNGEDISLRTASELDC